LHYPVQEDIKGMLKKGLIIFAVGVILIIIAVLILIPRLPQIFKVFGQ
jgi:hypothetical protein